jgi:hypothetical protein
LTLSEYDLHDSHIGHFRNGVGGGRTFWVGISAYRVTQIQNAAATIYSAALREAIHDVLGANPKSIIGNLSDRSFAELLSHQIQRSDRENKEYGTDASMRDDTNYRTEIVPILLDRICTEVRNETELLGVLEGIAARLRPRTESFNAGMSVGLATTSFDWKWAIIACVCIGIGEVLAKRIKRPNRSPGRGDVQAKGANNVSTCLSISEDVALAEVLDDLRVELSSKLHSPGREADEGSIATPPDLLLGEQVYSMSQMVTSASAKQAGLHALKLTPGRLLLLLLESGKWRTSSACKELLNLQIDAVAEIASTLQSEFVQWVKENEEPRLRDRNFVQDVLYSPPPPSESEVSGFCFVPLGRNENELSIPVDRYSLEDKIHFMYLVQTL